MKKHIRNLLLFSLTFLVGFFLFFVLISEQGLSEIVKNAGEFGWFAFVGLVSVSLVNFGFYSLRWQIIINSHLKAQDRVSLVKIFLHRMAGFSMSYLIPAAQVGGEPVRVALLACEPGVSVKQATSSVVLDLAFEISTFILFIISGVILALIQGLGSGSSLWITGISLCFVFGIFVLFFSNLARGKGFFIHIFRFFRLNRLNRFIRLEQQIIETETMMSEFLYHNPRLVMVISLLSILVISFRIVEVFFIFYFFHIDINFAQAFLISTLPGIALILPIPAGLGFFEAGFATLFSILAVSLNPLAFALIIRTRDLIFLVFGLIHMFSRGTSFVKENVSSVIGIDKRGV